MAMHLSTGRNLWPIACVRRCGRHVDPVRGGAFCDTCRPVDLTGGVAPSDIAEARPRERDLVTAVGRGRRHRFSEEEVAGWCERYRAGESSGAIAERDGVNSSVVCYHLARKGVQLRGWTGHAAGKAGVR